MNWPEVFKGIQLCIGFQLLLLAIFLLNSKQRRNHLLGFYTVLISISSLSSGLYTYLEKTPILSFLFGAHLIIFHAPLLYLYIKSLGKNESSVWPHLVFPVFYTLFYLVLKIQFGRYFSEHGIQILIAHLLLSVSVTSGYLYSGSKYFTAQLNDSLKHKALRKFRLFYLITNAHSISLYSLMAISYISYIYFAEEFLSFNTLIVPKVFSIIVYIHPITSIIFIIYLLSETHSLQSLILDKGINKSTAYKENRKDISSEVLRKIDSEKKFKDPEFGLSQFAREIGISEKEIAEYFNEELSTSFHEYLGRKRIEEFKRLLHQDVESAYSLEGLAHSAGFKSKATFYRAFKKEEGITPAKYKEQRIKEVLP